MVSRVTLLLPRNQELCSRILIIFTFKPGIRGPNKRQMTTEDETAGKDLIKTHFDQCKNIRNIRHKEREHLTSKLKNRLNAKLGHGRVSIRRSAVNDLVTCYAFLFQLMPPNPLRRLISFFLFCSNK